MWHAKLAFNNCYGINFSYQIASVAHDFKVWLSFNLLKNLIFYLCKLTSHKGCITSFKIEIAILALISGDLCKYFDKPTPAWYICMYTEAGTVLMCFGSACARVQAATPLHR